MDDPKGNSTINTVETVGYSGLCKLASGSPKVEELALETCSFLSLVLCEFELLQILHFMWLYISALEVLTS